MTSLALAILILAGATQGPEDWVPEWPAPSSEAADPASVQHVEPPEDMIDFLGRRRECRSIDPDRESGSRRAIEERESRWFGCGRLARDEAALRARYASLPRALDWLDLPPGKYEPPWIVAHSYHGPPPVRVKAVELRGTDETGAISYRVSGVLGEGAVPSTRLTVSFGSGSERILHLPARLFPWVDLTSLWAAIDPDPERRQMIVQLRYGQFRGWCGHVDRDDRPGVSVVLAPDGITSVSREIMTNCRSAYEDVEPSDLVAPAG
jgi:hypothetical protein